MSPAAAEIGFLPLYGEPARSTQIYAMRILARAMGLRLKLLKPGYKGPLPERTVISGEEEHWPDLDGGRIQLFLPRSSGAPNSMFLKDWVEPGPIPVFGELKRMPEHQELPWSYRGGGRPLAWQSRGGVTRLQLGFDLLGPVFHWLSLQEEQVAERRENCQASMSTAHPWTAEGLFAVPWVDRASQFLVTLLDLKGEGEQSAPLLPRWRARAPWALCLSHDVDMLFKWRFRSMIRLLLQSPVWALSGRARLLARLWHEAVATKRGARDPWFLVDEMMDLEERYQVHSSMLFLAESHDHQTFRYKLDSLQVKALLERVRERGFENGLHSGWHSFEQREILQREKGEMEAILGQPCPVTRRHWLRFDAARSWREQEECGFKVDGTLGWNDQAGFRAGTSLPFHPWDKEHQRERELLALPLVLMDSQLFDEAKLEIVEARAKTQEMLDWIRRSKGMLGVNWHPHVLCRQDFPGRRDLYEEILEAAAGDGAWTAPMGEIAAWWLSREQELERPCAS